MYFLIEDDDLLEKYDIISVKVSADTKKEFDSKLVYNNIKSHSDKVTDCYDKEIPNVDSNHTYSQLFLQECKCIEKKVIRHINSNFNDFSYSDESDKEYVGVG